MNTIRNEIGRMKGYGECGSCHDTYDWKAYHSIPINGSRGMFPYCEECHGTIPLRRKKLEIDKLLTRWMQYNFWEEDWNKLRATIHAAVEAGK